MNIASQISAKDIELLNETDFRELIDNLLHAETSNSREYVIYLSVPSKENTADDAEDGRLILDNKFTVNQFITHHKTFFQIKAYDIQPKECANEIVRTINGREEIKPKIKQAIEDGYSYVWYIKKNLSPRMRNQRIAKTKESFAKHDIHNVEVQLIDADGLKNWVNKFPSLIAYVKFCIKKQDSNGIQWLEQCPEYKTPYKSSEAMFKFADEVLNYVSDPDSTDAIRIIGNSGIGKTHFIINTLSRDEYIKIQCLYINCSYHGDISNIITLVNHYKYSRCILVLDNCSLENHKEIQKQKAELASFKLISIDSNLEGGSYPEYRLIQITSDNQVETVKKILDTVIIGNHREMYLNSLAEYCYGYPLLANTINLAINKHGLDDLDISKLVDKITINKWLFGKDSELSKDNVKRIIVGLSFFSYIRFTDNSTKFGESEKKSADDQFKFLTRHFFDNIPQREFRGICRRLIERGFLEEKGTLIAVKPLPLAAYMIRNAIDTNAIDLNDDFRLVLQELNGSISPSIKALELPLMLQLEKIVTSGLSDVINIVNVVFGEKSPFSMAENLFTVRGSLILRHLANIDPKLTVKLIQNIITLLSHDDLLKISGQTRRNIIWALQTLCYGNTFSKAVKLLLRFAGAENESISNNATGQFTHLFQLYLPGTQASYKERVNIINWGVNHQDQQCFIPVLIKAIARAFYRGGVMGNPRSSQDTKHLNEYQPKTKKEILDYWISLLEVLTNNFNVFPADGIYKVFNNSILSTLLETGQFEYVDKFIELFQMSSLFAPYSELINTLKRLKEHNKDIDISKIDDLLNMLQPTDLIGRIQTQIISPSYGFGEHALSEKDRCVLKIAQELLELSETGDCYKLLINSDSWVISELGMKIGEIDSKRAQQIFYEIIDKFDLSNIKVSFISGILWGINDQFFINECFKVLATRDCIDFIFNLSANIRINKDIFTILLTLKNKSNLSSDYFSKLNFSQVPSLERKWFVNKLQELDSVGIYKIIDLLNMNQTEMQPAEWLDYAEQLLKTNVFLICNQSNADYPLYAVLVKLIELKEDMVEQISSQLNDYCVKMLHGYPATHYWHNLFSILINKAYTVIWNKYLGELFLQDWQGCFFVRNILNLNLLCDSDDRSKLLLEWCRHNKDRKAHILMARNIVIFDENDQCIPFVINLIKSFNEDAELLDAINSRMNEYSWQGDVSNYYLKCLTQLENMQRNLIDNDFVLVWIDEARQNFKKQYELRKKEEDEFKLIARSY